jgi:YVTN family beta-propeller protein
VYNIDTATNAVVGAVTAGKRPWGIALSPDSKTLYSANGPSNDVSEIDLAGNRVSHSIKAGDGPWGIVVLAR